MAERRWCQKHQQMRDVEDQFTEDTGDSRVTVEVYSVTVLDCGCSIEVVTGEYRSPLQQAGPTPASFPRANEWGD